MTVLAVDRLSKHEVLRKVGEEMEKLASEHPEGLLTAESVVDAAAHPESALHPFFNWDDSTAAREYRLLQARSLIRKVRISNPQDMNAQPVPKFVSLMNDRGREGGGYRQTEDVIADDELLAELERTAKSELEAWMRRHTLLTDLCHSVAKAAGIKPPESKKRFQRGKGTASKAG